MDNDSCTNCGRSFIDYEHPVQIGSKTTYPYRLETSVEVPEVYDGALYYIDSPHNGGCGLAWHRWSGPESIGPKRWDVAQEAIVKINSELLGALEKENS